jgi:hypothetical protein
MQYRLRTLLIVLAWGPLFLALAYYWVSIAYLTLLLAVLILPPVIAEYWRRQDERFWLALDAAKRRRLGRTPLLRSHIVGYEADRRRRSESLGRRGRRLAESAADGVAVIGQAPAPYDFEQPRGSVVQNDINFLAWKELLVVQDAQAASRKVASKNETLGRHRRFAIDGRVDDRLGTGAKIEPWKPADVVARSGQWPLLRKEVIHRFDHRFRRQSCHSSLRT